MTNPQDERSGETFTGGNALELVAYQTGAVVSRQFVKKKTGTVTIFAFSKAPASASVVLNSTRAGHTHRVMHDTV